MANESAVKEEEVAVSFDATEAMNTAGFVEFLAEVEDAETDDPETLRVSFEAFKNKKETSDRLSALLKNELNLKGLGIEFDDAELAEHIGDRVEGMAREDPEKINEIFRIFAAFEASSNQIIAAEARIAALTQKGDLEAGIAELDKKTELLESAAESEKFLTGAGFTAPLVAAYERFAFRGSVDFAKEWLEKNEGSPTVRTREEMQAFIKERSGARRRSDARLAIQRDYSVEPDGAAIEKELENTKAEIALKSKQIEVLDELEKENQGNKERFTQIRGLLLAQMGTNKGLMEVAKRKVKEKLTGLIDSDPDKAMLYFENLKTASGEGSFNIDYIGSDADEIQKSIEGKIDEKLSLDMRDVVEKTPFGDRAYNKLAGSLEKFLKRDKVGSKEGEKARAFVMSTLTSIAREVAPKDKARGILINFMLARLLGRPA